MKLDVLHKAIELRKSGFSINEIANKLGIAKSTASVYVKNVKLTDEQKLVLRANSHSASAIEKRRNSRLASENAKREYVIQSARNELSDISLRELWLMGVMLYRAEGGKTQRVVRFSNGDPKMIEIMMKFFRQVCQIREDKLRGYIHIHETLDVKQAESYWSKISGIPLSQFYKTYNKPNKSSKNTRNSLPYGVFDIYISDAKLFLKIQGWAEGIFGAKVIK